MKKISAGLTPAVGCVSVTSRPAYASGPLYQPPWAQPLAPAAGTVVLRRARQLYPDWSYRLPDFGEALLALLGAKSAALLMDWPRHDAPRLEALVHSVAGAVLVWPPGCDPLIYRPATLVAAVKRLPAVTRRLGLRHASAERLALAVAC